ncbi:MAG: hypothetical protein JWM89_2646 [Acidimicrobiales bacterium]|nr:hypothetical protein [Acidimicrobiales bacterium]
MAAPRRTRPTAPDPHATGSPWSGRSHAELAELARELLLAGHLIDRSGMPHLIGRLGRDGMRDVAIDEWMAASPIYTKRMQRLLGFEGDTVEVIFKGMQLDVGAPPEFMDFRYEITDDHHGAFHLDHCGALMDVEPMGDDYVQAMCHDIEDPTFDATATATNPRAQVRPIHRPPRIPADRAPHCAWSVTIDPEAAPLPVPAQAEWLATSAAARVPLAAAPADLPTGDGWSDYTASLDPDLVMERFSSATLAAVLDETALQGHLLSRAYLLQVASKTSGAEAIEIGIKQATGIAGLTTKRLAAALGASADIAGLARVLEVHPMLLPRTYVAATIDRQDDALVVHLAPCPATDEPDGLTWPALLTGRGGEAILHAAAVCLDPQAQVERVEAHPGDLATWLVHRDPTAPPAAQPDEVTLTEFSTGAGFSFHRRG